MARKRDYEKEGRWQASEIQKKRRAERNRDRAAAMKAGKVRKGDGKEVDHVGSHRTGDLSGVPTRVISKKANRSRQPKRS